MNVVGYTLYGQHNDSWMFDEDAPIPRCPSCRYRLTFGATNPQYRLRKSRRDYSGTYDGQWIVSGRFRDFCLSNGIPGAEFRPFERDGDHFHFIAVREVKFDPVRAQTRFLKMCLECENYESVIGSAPCYLQSGEKLDAGFFRTDLIFASGDEKRAVVLVGPETRTLLKTSKLHGLEFEEAWGLE